MKSRCRQARSLRPRARHRLRQGQREARTNPNCTLPHRSHRTREQTPSRTEHCRCRQWDREPRISRLPESLRPPPLPSNRASLETVRSGRALHRTGQGRTMQPLFRRELSQPAGPAFGCQPPARKSIWRISAHRANQARLEEIILRHCLTVIYAKISALVFRLQPHWAAI